MCCGKLENDSLSLIFSKILIYSLFLQGPLIRGWFLTLEKIFGSTVTLKRTVAKVTLDQLFYAPSQQTVILVTIGALQGFSLQQIGDKVQRELPTITFTGWKVSKYNEFIKYSTVYRPGQPNWEFRLWIFHSLEI